MTNPTTAEILSSMGEAGRRICAIDASEAGAGNISCAVSWEPELESFDEAEEIPLPVTVPALAGRTLFVTGSGRRLRQIADDPLANVGLLVVHPGGESGTLRSSRRRRFRVLTSELNSHLAVHADQVTARGVDFLAVVHAQPIHLTYLSHLAEYRDTVRMNARLIRWEPETVVALPEGIDVLEFMVPGSEELQQHNVAALRDHQIVLWSKHGVMARSDISATGAVDKLEYVETAARYEVLDMSMGRRAEGLSLEELRRVKAAFRVPTSLV